LSGSSERQRGAKPLQKPHPPVFASGVITPESYVWVGQMGTAFFIPAPEIVKANIGLYRNAVMKLAARFPRPEGPNPLDHCEKKRRG